MSAPHDETHEMHNEVATVARAMLSAGPRVLTHRYRAAGDTPRITRTPSPTAPRLNRPWPRAQGEPSPAGGPGVSGAALPRVALL